LTKYYATAFKTGAYPAITQDKIIMWSRPHPKAATASNDGTGRPTGWDHTDDNLYAVVMSTDDAVVSLTSGTTTTQFSVSAGLTKLKVPSQVGTMGGQISRNGQVTASYNAGNSFQYTQTPSTYNFNYMIGSS
jgi:glucan endo-1,3-alpha-glucosidase